MTDLTDDEFTVLLIAERGESMMPIGRWEKPVNDLAARGLLHRHDKFNNAITEKGKEALKQHDAELDQDLETAMNKAAISANSVRMGITPAEIEEYRKHLADLGAFTREQPPKTDAPIFMVFRSPCLMEDEGRHFYIKTYATEEAAKKWIAAQKGEYFDPGAYYVIRGHAVV